MNEYVISNTTKMKMVDHASITFADPFSDIEGRIDRLNKDVDRTINALRVNVIKKKSKFRNKHYKFYYGRI